ncbi:hypothetical protein EXIGLDRAFT_791359 [Exidia glandulosa HHB12029]|uniref:Uncharacterized protein n=1 Tax=Exidia glandulosa HHB12029 TaxID=1314781 RepID=A0A166MGE3_EXIGL|nr:hypothetical protein EXIGLDRAFT_791359 [Exidia glandulosa HHB12029]
MVDFTMYRNPPLFFDVDETARDEGSGARLTDKFMYRAAVEHDHPHVTGRIKRSWRLDVTEHLHAALSGGSMQHDAGAFEPLVRATDRITTEQRKDQDNDGHSEQISELYGSGTRVATASVQKYEQGRPQGREYTRLNPDLRRQMSSSWVLSLVCEVVRGTHARVARNEMRETADGGRVRRGKRASRIRHSADSKALGRSQSRSILNGAPNVGQYRLLPTVSIQLKQILEPCYVLFGLFAVWLPLSGSACGVPVALRGSACGAARSGRWFDSSLILPLPTTYMETSHLK